MAKKILGEIPFEEKIVAISYFFCLPPSLVAAIADVESGFYPYAYRYEPHFEKRYVRPWAKKKRPGADGLEMRLLATSLGIMQVMGLVAVELGHPSNRLPELFDCEKGLWFGCRKLRQLMKRYGGDTEKVISAYNQGSARFIDLDRDGKKDVNEPFRNEFYVKKVLVKMKEYKRLDR